MNDTDRPRAVTTKDVATRAGVAAGTVSNVLNSPHLVAPETRRRVEEAIADLGFVRNESARQLRVGRSRTIALVVPELTHPSMDEIAAGADDAADAADAMVVVSSSSNSPDRERRHLARLAQHRLLGLMLISVHEPPWDLLTEIEMQGTPVVLINHTPLRADCQPVVAIDDHRGGQLVGTHLLAAGHRHVAYLSPQSQQSRARLAGLRSTLGEARIEVVQCKDMTVASGVQGASNLLARGQGTRPSAVFCGNDLIAIGVLDHCRTRGISVPESLAVIGYGDIAMASSTTVSLTSVCRPRYELGTGAVDLVLRSPGRGHRTDLVPRLVIRGSSTLAEGTSPPPGRNTLPGLAGGA